MTHVPDRAELLTRIENRYRGDIERAKAARVASLAAIDKVDPVTLHALALLFTSDDPSEPIPESLVTPTDHVASLPQFADILNGVIDPPDPSDYGGISKRIRAVVKKMKSDFTVQDIIIHSESPQPKATTIAGVMKRMVNEGVVQLVHQGAGKRPSTFRLFMSDTNGEVSDS